MRTQNNSAQIGGVLLRPRKRSPERFQDAAERERERERRDIAFQLAKQVRDQKRRELEKRGVTGEALKAQTPDVGELADFY